MKKEWVEPRIQVQQFAPNDAVSACIGGKIQCAYPGNSSTNGDWKFDDYNGKESGWYTDHWGDDKYTQDEHGHLHGLCGNNATLTFSGDTASGYERKNDGSIDYSRPIYNITGWDRGANETTDIDWNNAVKGEYDVAWNSKDTNEGLEYFHIGRLIIDWLDPLRHNHSG